MRGDLMEYTLQNGTTIVIKEATEEYAKAIVDTMAIIVGETKNLGRDYDEWNITEEQEKEHLSRFVKSPNDYMAIALDGDTVIGVASFHGSRFKRLQHRVNLGISILKAYHHQGLGTYMMQHLLDQAHRMKKHTVALEVRADNTPAVSLYKKLGFVVEGVKKYGFYVDGHYVDELWMAYYMEEHK